MAQQDLDIYWGTIYSCDPIITIYVYDGSCSGTPYTSTVAWGTPTLTNPSGTCSSIIYKVTVQFPSEPAVTVGDGCSFSMTTTSIYACFGFQNGISYTPPTYAAPTTSVPGGKIVANAQLRIY